MSEHKRQYQQNHLSAKVIVCCIQLVLVLLIDIVQTKLLILLAVVLYYFGVNTVAYLLEHIRGHRHRHDKI